MGILTPSSDWGNSVQSKHWNCSLGSCRCVYFKTTTPCSQSVKQTEWLPQLARIGSVVKSKGCESHHEMDACFHLHLPCIAGMNLHRQVSGSVASSSSFASLRQCNRRADWTLNPLTASTPDQPKNEVCPWNDEHIKDQSYRDYLETVAVQPPQRN